MRIGIGLVALIAVAACGDILPSDELTAARKRWDAWGPASYDLTIHPSCECLLLPARVLVRDGVIEKRHFLAVGVVEIPEGATPDAETYPDVPGLFARIGAEIAVNHIGSVEYDAMTGHPRNIVFDYDGPSSNTVDGEVTYRITLIAR